MRLPERMPARVSRFEASINTDPSAKGSLETTGAVRGSRDVETGGGGLSPAACCAQACVNVPFVGQVCHCVLDLPVCP